MINNTIQNKSSKTEKIQEHELVIVNLLKKLYSSSESEIKNTSVPLIKELKWFNHIFYNKPICLLFSIDQFFFEFAKKQPRRKKTSEFQRQLKERKKLSFFYGYLSKKQIKNLIFQSKKHQGYFSKNFFSLLERRLDIVLYRSGLVKNIVTARQLISHKKVKVNNKILNIASHQVYPGDIISVMKTHSTLSCLTKGESSRKKRKKSNDFPKLFSIFSVFSKEKNEKTVHNYTNWKISKQKKLLKNFISLLLTKVEKRVYVRIEKTVFFNKKGKLGNLLQSFFTKKDKKRNEKKKNFTLLKFKPLLSKQAQSFLFMCMQKNYLSVDRKPLFSNKYPYFKEFSISQNKYFSIDGINNKKQKQFVSDNSVVFKGLRNSQFTRKFSTCSFFLSIFSNEKTEKINREKKKNEKSFFSFEKNEKKTEYSRIYSRKRNTILYRNFVSRTFLLMHSSPFYSIFSVFSKEKNEKTNYALNMKKDFAETSKTSNQSFVSQMNTNTLLTLKLKNNITKKRSTNFDKAGKKPMHLEVSYSLSTVIFLYSPQRLNFPFSIDVDLVLRSFQ